MARPPRILFIWIRSMSFVIQLGSSCRVTQTLDILFCRTSVILEAKHGDLLRCRRPAREKRSRTWFRAGPRIGSRPRRISGTPAPRRTARPRSDCSDVLVAVPNVHPLRHTHVTLQEQFEGL